MKIEGTYILGTAREIAEIVLFDILNSKKKDKDIFSMDFMLADEEILSLKGTNLEDIFLSSKKKNELFGVKPIDTGFCSSLNEVIVDSYGGGNGQFISFRKEEDNLQQVVELRSAMQKVIEPRHVMHELMKKGFASPSNCSNYLLIGKFQKDIVELLGYIKTDDAQWVRRIDLHNYHIVEVRDYEKWGSFICQGYVNLTDYLNDDGTYDKEAVSIIHSYYSSISEFSKGCSDDDSRCQLLAEMIFEMRELSDTRYLKYENTKSAYEDAERAIVAMLH